MRVTVKTWSPEARAAAAAKRRGESLEKRLGRCFELSAKHVVFNEPDAGHTLVHGSIRGGGNPRISHAWVKKADGTIYDPVLDQEFPPEVHRAFFKARVEHEYSTKEATSLAAKSKHWGPWEPMMHP